MFETEETPGQPEPDESTSAPEETAPSEGDLGGDDSDSSDEDSE